MADEMDREDIELVHLARDTCIHAAITWGNLKPQITSVRDDFLGYSPFLDKYLKELGCTFTRIVKRELKNGKLINTHRGCQCAGFMRHDNKSIAHMTRESVIISSTRAKKTGVGPTSYHKPIKVEELPSLSLFVYVVGPISPTKAKTSDELREEGHDPKKHGLVAVAGDYRGALCGDLDYITTIEGQLKAVCNKMQNSEGVVMHDLANVQLFRMEGRWLYDPVRPKSEYFF